MFSRETILLIICVVLFLALIFMVVFGCRCTYAEGFDTGVPKESLKSSDSDSGNEKQLTKHEQELFNDLKNNNLGDNHVQKLIDQGVLTEELVEKFLAKLDSTNKEAFTDIDEETKKNDVMKVAKDYVAKTNSAKKDSEADESTIEPFQGSVKEFAAVF